MEDKIENLLSFCSEIDFGAVRISEKEKAFRSELNEEVFSLCRSLPKSTQVDSLLLLMLHFGVPFGQESSFFGNYYAPSWSIIYWLIRSGPNPKGLAQEDIQNAKTAHSMALLLHPLDDHLNDNQWPATHLALLVRSQSWMIMNNALRLLASNIDGGEEIVAGFLEDYYSSISSSKDITSLDSYCHHFRNQMATGFITPALIIKKMNGNDDEYAHAIQTAYGSFGIAWRLLDDINDIQIDMKNRANSAVYVCLPDHIRGYWKQQSSGEPDKRDEYSKVVLEYILKNGVVERITERICHELDSAASISDNYKLPGLADEFHCLLSSLEDTENDL